MLWASFLNLPGIKKFEAATIGWSYKPGRRERILARYPLCRSFNVAGALIRPAYFIHGQPAGRLILSTNNGSRCESNTFTCLYCHETWEAPSTEPT